MEKLLIEDDKTYSLSQSGYESGLFSSEEYDRLARAYVEDVVQELSIDFKPEVDESFESEDSLESERTDNVRMSLGGAAVGMLSRFRESGDERKARREERRALKAARKTNRKESHRKWNELTLKEKLKKGLGTAAVAATGVTLAAVAADNLLPVEHLEQANNLMSNYIPGYSNFEQLSNTMDARAVEYDTSLYSVIVGGNGDTTGEWTRFGLGGIEGEGLNYPASISPAGPVTMRESIEAATPRLSEVFSQAESDHAEQYDFHGYSLGSVTVAEAANKYSVGGGKINGNVDIYLYGTPIVENTGAFSGGTVETISDVLDDVGVVYDTALPTNADVHSFKSDFWSNGGHSPLTSQVATLVGFGSDGHNIPIEGQNAVLSGVNEMSNGGTAYSYEHIEGPQNPILRTAEAHVPGFKAEDTPAFANFVDAIAPIGEVGSPDIPRIDTYDAINTGAAAIDEATSFHNLPPLHAEQFIQDVGIDNVAPVVAPIVDYLNQPADLSVFNTPEVSAAIQRVQDTAPHMPAGFDINAEMNNFADQAQQFGITIPRF